MRGESKLSCGGPQPLAPSEALRVASNGGKRIPRVTSVDANGHFQSEAGWEYTSGYNQAKGTNTQTQPNRTCIPVTLLRSATLGRVSVVSARSAFFHSVLGLEHYMGAPSPKRERCKTLQPATVGPK